VQTQQAQRAELQRSSGELLQAWSAMTDDNLFDCSQDVVDGPFSMQAELLRQQLGLSWTPPRCGSSDLSAEHPPHVLVEAQVSLELLLAALSRDDVDVDACNARGDTALHCAVQTGDARLDLVGALLDADGDPDVQRASDEHAPLHDAILASQLGCVILLLRAGADPDCTAQLEVSQQLPAGKPPLVGKKVPCSAAVPTTRTRAPPLHFALQLADAHALLMCRALLVIGSPELLARDEKAGLTALATAVASGQLPQTVALLEQLESPTHEISHEHRLDELNL